jgi:membrane-associated phospholipid phosphatase
VQTVLAAPTMALVDSRASAPAGVKAVRQAEWILFAFLLYAPALTFFLPTPDGLRFRLEITNLLALLLFAVMIAFDNAKPRLVLKVMRDWLPLGMILVAYREMGWFAVPHKGALLESRWVVWDRLVLDHGARAAIESLGRLIPSILEIAYALVYALPPLALGILYLSGRMEKAGQFLTVVLFSVLLCYAQFPFWPSEPPRVVFAGLDLPSYVTVFRRFNLWMLGNYGIHTSVFPSAHVAGALSAAFGLRLAMPEGKWAYRSLFVIAVLIAIATVYGRYHYLADAICGALLACIVNLVMRARTVGIIRPGALRPNSEVNRQANRSRGEPIRVLVQVVRSASRLAS